jgi:hypothetical protein
MTPSEASTVQTFHQSMGKQLVTKDPGACQVLRKIITFKEIKSFPIVLSFFPKLGFIGKMVEVSHMLKLIARAESVFLL